MQVKRNGHTKILWSVSSETWLWDLEELSQMSGTKRDWSGFSVALSRNRLALRYEYGTARRGNRSCDRQQVILLWQVDSCQPAAEPSRFLGSNQPGINSSDSEAGRFPLLINDNFLQFMSPCVSWLSIMPNV
jgi:hypothetical protein